MKGFYASGELPKDCHGNTVSIGDKIRVISFAAKFLKELSEEEQAHIRSMIGDIFDVDEIDEYGHPWVTKWWYLEDGKSHSHSLALLPEELEKVITPPS